MLTQQDWQNAIEIQFACNLSGVTFSFAEMMHRLCDETNACKQGTAWRNHHPLVILWVDKLADLANVRPAGGMEAYSAALREAERRVADWDTAEEVLLEGADDAAPCTWEVIRVLNCRDDLKKYDTDYWGYPHVRMVPTRDRYELLNQIVKG